MLVLIPYAGIQGLQKFWFRNLDFRTVNFDVVFGTLVLQIFMLQSRLITTTFGATI